MVKVAIVESAPEVVMATVSSAFVDAPEVTIEDTELPSIAIAKESAAPDKAELE